MSGERTTSKKHEKARAKLGRKEPWTLALAALALTCICTVVTAVAMLAGERGAIQGSGVVIAEDRPVSPFVRVSLQDVGSLIIRQGEDDALTVETDDNLMRHIETRVRGGTLILDLGDEARRRGVRPTGGITYLLSVRDLAGLEVADSGRIQADALDVGHLEIEAHDAGTVSVDSLLAHTVQAYIEDSGNVHLDGLIERQEVTVQDSGCYLAGRLQSRTAAVLASDSAEATVWTMEALDATVVDSGRVRYYGEPRRAERLRDHGTLTGLGEP